MRPDISEFSYGYALTEALTSIAPTRIRAAPQFPSLIEEGRAGGGYDVKIPYDTVPLFLQFKLCDCMTRRGAIEVKGGHLGAPFFRMHLRPTKHSKQHPMLLDLEASGAAVFYAAPKFHTPKELDSAYLTGSIIRNSIFVQPSSIGVLPDDEAHHLAFEAHGGPLYLFSNSPRQLSENYLYHRGISQILDSAGSNLKRIDSSFECLSDWNQLLMRIIHTHLGKGEGPSTETLRFLQSISPLQQFIYMASSYFGGSVVFISKVKDGSGNG